MSINIFPVNRFLTNKGNIANGAYVLRLYCLELNETYLTIDMERIDLILGRKMMRWGTGDGINPMGEVNEFPLPDSPWEPKGLKELRRSAESGEIVLFPVDKSDGAHIQA